MRPFYTDRENVKPDKGVKADVSVSGGVPSGSDAVGDAPAVSQFTAGTLDKNAIPAPKKRPSVLQRLQALFRFGTRGVANKSGLMVDNGQEVYPVETRTSPRSSFKDLYGNFPPEIKRLWDSYTNQTSDSSDTLRERNDRYTDMDYMMYNDPVTAHAEDLYADEVSQIDDQFNIIDVDSDNPAVSDEIKKLFTTWGINQEYIWGVAHNLVGYGDSFDINECSDGNGITSVTPVSVYDITDRLEFKASEQKKKNAHQDKFVSWNASSKSVDAYITDVQARGNNSPASAFSSYLFGFVVSGDTYLYPWQVNHYRLQPNRSEFFPFGRPLFINLIGPYRQLKTTQNLMALGRMMKFPKSIYSVQTGDDMTTGEKWDAVNNAREDFTNTGYTNKSKDGLSMGDEYWLPKGLIDFDQFTNDINLDDIGDVEYLRENQIMGTGIPKGYLLVGSDNSWGGDSGSSLIQQSKPFGRAVYRIQSAILEQLSSMVRIHFMLADKFDGEFTKFSLSLNFPVSEERSELMKMKSDSLGFAKQIIDDLKEILGYEGDVPPELVKKVFSKFSFLSSAEVEDYVNDFLAVQSSEGDGSSDGSDSIFSKGDSEDDSDNDGDLFSDTSSESGNEPEMDNGSNGEEGAETEMGGNGNPPPPENGKVSAESVKDADDVHRLGRGFVPTARDKRMYEAFRSKCRGRVTESQMSSSFFHVCEKRGISDIHVGGKHMYVSNPMGTPQDRQVSEMYRALGSYERLQENDGDGVSK